MGESGRGRRDDVHTWRATSLAWRCVLAGVFLLALGIRLPGLADPPLDFAPVRQLHSAGLARGYYLSDASPGDHPPGRVVTASANREPEIEPPLMELTAVLGYDLLGSEQLWWPRSLSVALWVASGVIVAALALRLFGHHAALVSTAAFLLLPFGIRASRSFQPDPLMVLLILGTALAATATADSPSRRTTRLTVGLAAGAVFVKVVAAFFVLPVLAALALHITRTRREALRRLGGWVGLALVPAGAWYVYGRYVSGFLVAQDDGRVSPKLLWTVAFWEGWAKRAADVLPVPRPAALVLWLVLALAVALSLRRAERWTQLLLGSLAAGYVLFGLVFTVHYSTHDYYHLPLVGLLALALGVVWSRIVGRIERPAAALLATGAVAAALALPILWERSSFRPSEQDVRQRVYRSEAIGRLLDHSTAVGFIADDFGLSLTYFGDVSGTLWDPRLNEPPSATFERLFGGGAVDYLVVTDTRLEDFSAVEPLIEEEYPILAEGSGWVVYDLRRA